MKSTRTILASCVATGLLALSSAAHADEITTILDALPDGTPIQFKYNNLENVVTEVGQTLDGILTISSIGDIDGTPIYWASGFMGLGELNGYFSGLNVAQITPTTGGSDIFFTGGTINLYLTAAGVYDPTGATVDDQICGGPCGTPWLTLTFIPGVIDVDDPTTPGFDETLTTLYSTVDGQLATPTGTGDGVLVATGGTAAYLFAGTTFSLQSNLQSCALVPPDSPFAPNCANAGDYPIASFDPVVGVINRVPEPATLVLAGLGLLGVGLSRRRKA